MNGGINEQGEEEIPPCGWNWMVISEGGMGDTWCRGCCQAWDSRVFVFSIITCCPSPPHSSSLKDHSAFTFSILSQTLSYRSSVFKTQKWKWMKSRGCRLIFYYFKYLIKLLSSTNNAHTCMVKDLSSSTMQFFTESGKSLDTSLFCHAVWLKFKLVLFVEYSM